MKKHLLFLVFLLAGAMAFSQSEIVINDFSGSFNNSNITGDNLDADGAHNRSLISFENGFLKAEYNWNRPDWYPRAVVYEFDNYVDMSAYPVLQIRFMAEDDYNDSIGVRLDLYGDGAEPINDTIRTHMSTNANPLNGYVTKGVWYTIESDFTDDRRFYTTYWNGFSIPLIRIDSTRIKGFEAYTNFGDSATANEPGTLWIDYLKVKDQTGIGSYIIGKETAFALALFPSPAVDILNVNAENIIDWIDIFDIRGVHVLHIHEINQTFLVINVSGFSPGIFIAKVHDLNGNMVSRKFLKN